MNEEDKSVIDRPSHYDGDECMKSIERDGDGMSFCLGSAKKYLWRQGRKHPRVREDVGKAQWYLARARSYAHIGSWDLIRIEEYESMCTEVLEALDNDAPIPDLRDRLRAW